MAKIAPTGISAAKVPIIARRVGRAELTEFLVAANRKHPPRLRLSPVGQSPNHRRAEKDGTISHRSHPHRHQHGRKFRILGIADHHWPSTVDHALKESLAAPRDRKSTRLNSSHT